jgi:hypothetical protein
VKEKQCFLRYFAYPTCMMRESLLNSIPDSLLSPAFPP